MNIFNPFAGSVIDDLKDRIQMLENNPQIASMEPRNATLEIDLSNIKSMISTNISSITNLTKNIEGIDKLPTGSFFGTKANFTSIVNRVNALENTSPAVDEKSNTWYDYETFTN